MKPFIYKANLVVCVVMFSVFFSVTSAQIEPSQRDRIIVKPQPTQTPRISPTPKVAPAQTTPTAQVQTVADLQIKIRQVLQGFDLRRAQIGVKIASLDSGKTIYEENAEKLLMPASNMKSFTVAAALDRLTPNFRFVTSVYASSNPDASGLLRGDLIIYGRGDPSFAASFNDGDYYKGINDLADKIVATGIKKIEGNLIGDESFFTSETLPVPETWEIGDLQWYYGAEVSALTVNDNALDLIVKPSNVGSPAIVTLSPTVPQLIIVNKTVTVASGAKREIAVARKLGANTIEVSGTIPANDKNARSQSVAVPRPAEVFVSMLRAALTQRSVTISGQTRSVDANFRKISPLVNPIELTKLESPPFSIIAAKTMKPSQNLYTELILRTLGETVGDKTNAKLSSTERGLAVVQNFINQNGITSDSVFQYDGCGLSRHNLITANSAVQLFTAMSKSRFAEAWRNSLTIGGVDGTLQSRFKNTTAANNVRGKSGSFDQVATLSGYVTSASGERFVFSIIVNNLPNDSGARRTTVDDIIVMLASFNG